MMGHAIADNAETEQYAILSEAKILTHDSANANSLSCLII
jgi:hypothetical protein